ncbi:hypothetical protein [Kitasatospora sp. NPDC057223]|uniref:hypothetical protein n=1 Tax=Kitasatospora sp. NPDC057223 TaxID=3346055 RepID=UPI0036262694
MQARWRIGATVGAGAAIAATLTLWNRQSVDIGPVLGTTIVVTIAAAAVLILMRQWISTLGDRLADTTQERQQLRDRTAQAQVAEIAHVAIREQLLAAAAAAEHSADARAQAAEEAADQRIAEATSAIRREFEQKRAIEMSEMYELGAMNERNGVHKHQAAVPVADLILLSERRRPTPTENTSRGAGVTSP